MRKKISSVFTALALVALMAFLMVEGAEAFCVNNKTDRQIVAEQTGGHKTFRGFSQTINPGDNQCCNWANKDCNKSGGKTDPVSFTVFSVISGRVVKTVCENYQIPANGDLYINGSNGNYSCSQNP